MNYIALDLETTGLDWNSCSILQIAAIVFNPSQGTLGELNMHIKYPHYSGEAIALAMNSHTLKACEESGIPLGDARETFSSFLGNFHERLTPVGFNVSAFDVNFLKAHEFSVDNIHHRGLELGTLFSKNCEPATSSDVTKEFLEKDVEHNALSDAYDAMNLMLMYLRDRDWTK